MINTLIEKIKGKGTRIVFTEGSDARILEAAVRLHKEQILTPVLLGNRAEIMGAAASLGFDIDGIEMLDPREYKNMEMMVKRVIQLRKGKLDEPAARAACLKTNFFGTMYVELGCADGLLGGATYSTADTVRPALQLIKTKPGSSIVSSCFIMQRGDDEKLVMGDCSINIDPSADDLVEIALQTAKTVRQFGIEPRVGLLSYSTLGSAKGSSVDKVKEAALRLKRMDLDFGVEGEIQFDCAVAPEVSKLKAPDSKVAGRINTFIFPNIDSGNIGYKIAARLGGYEAVGPILQGLNAPINDLSRGCNAEEVFKMAIVTAAQKYMDI